MFEKLLQEIENLKSTKISVPIDKDSEGYLDKECPNTNCEFGFKVFEEDWDEIKKNDTVFCPMCRHTSKADSWWTKEQLEQAKQQALKHIRGLFGNALEEGAAQFNSGQSNNSFIKLSMSISNPSPYHNISSIPANEEMRIKITCKECNCRYSVIGSAFFCPKCGHNSAEETFDNSIAKIENKIKNLNIIRKALEKVSRDEAETTCRSLIETSLNECLVAFQRFCEVTFSKKMPNEKVKFNAFQNLEISSKYWELALKKSYIDWLTNSEYKTLIELFQKRHLLSHTEGIVDQKYIDKSGDLSYAVGQRIIVKENDITEMIFLVKKIVRIIRKK